MPSAAHSAFAPVPNIVPGAIPSPRPSSFHQIPNQLRWDPFDFDVNVNFIQGLHMIAGAGDVSTKNGIGIYVFAAGKDMDERSAFYSADGDFLIVLQHGEMDVETELGR